MYIRLPRLVSLVDAEKELILNFASKLFSRSQAKLVSFSTIKLKIPTTNHINCLHYVTMDMIYKIVLLKQNITILW